MNMFIADTNIFIRFFTNDDPFKAQAIWNILQKVKSKKIELFITESVFTEIVYVLSSPKLYAVERKRVGELLKSILVLENAKMERKPDCMRALDIFAELKLDIEDCILLAKAERMKADGIISFDKGLDVAKSIARMEKL